MTAREFEVASVVVLGSALGVLLVKEHMLAPKPAPSPGGTPPPPPPAPGPCPPGWTASATSCCPPPRLQVPCRAIVPAGTATGGAPDPRSVSF